MNELQQLLTLIDECELDDSDNDLLALLGMPVDEPLRFALPVLPQAKKQRSKALPWVALALMTVLCVVMLSGAALVALSRDGGRAVAGLRVLNVTSNSMAPTTNTDGNILPGWFRQNDAIIVRETTAANVQVNDVVTIDRGPNQLPLTHRVRAILENFNDPTGLGFITQGDANRSPDPNVGGSQIIGVTVFRVPYAGHVLGFVQENLVASIAACAGIFLLLLVVVIATFAGKKKGAVELLP